MAGFAGLERRESCLVVADFSHEDHIRRLAHRAAQTAGKRRRITAYFTLREQAAVVRKDVLDGIFDRHHMAGDVFVHPLQQCSQRG